MIPDYHVHTYYSGDCEVPVKEHLNKAIRLGMKEICFTDHTDFDYPPENGANIFLFDVPKYFNELSELKDEYKGRITIKTGIELGLNPANIKPNKELINSHAFDFVIGSSHIIDGRDPYYEKFWEEKNPDDVIAGYFEAILVNITGESDYDVYGHLDYIRRYVPDKNYVFNPSKFSGLTDEILMKIIGSGHGIELNTRGLSYGNKHFEPTIGLLRRYKELGGEILTVGSDAHYSENLGYGFDVVENIIKDCGFKYITTFSKRKPEFIKL